MTAEQFTFVENVSLDFCNRRIREQNEYITKLLESDRSSERIDELITSARLVRIYWRDQSVFKTYSNLFK